MISKLSKYCTLIQVRNYRFHQHYLLFHRLYTMSKRQSPNKNTSSNESPIRDQSTNRQELQLSGQPKTTSTGSPEPPQKRRKIKLGSNVNQVDNEENSNNLDNSIEITFECNEDENGNGNSYENSLTIKNENNNCSNTINRMDYNKYT